MVHVVKCGLGQSLSLTPGVHENGAGWLYWAHRFHHRYPCIFCGLARIQEQCLQGVSALARDVDTLELFMEADFASPVGGRREESHVIFSH